MGAGGLGAYYGARLQQAGHAVTFIARGAHLAAMRERGLRVISPAGDALLPAVAATDDPKTIGHVDHIVFSVKLWDSDAVAQAMLPMIGPATTIVSFQNGVEKDETLVRVGGTGHVIGGVSYISVKIAEPGVIEHTGALARVILGELDNAKTERVAALATAYAGAQVGTSVSDDISRATWEKFVYLAALSGMTSLLRSTIGPIRENAEARSLFRDAMLEAVNVGRAAGVALDPAFAEVQLQFSDTLPPQMRASMAVDLERGRRLELPWLSGAVDRLGRSLSVATPVSGVIARALALYQNGAPDPAPKT